MSCKKCEGCEVLEQRLNHIEDIFFELRTDIGKVSKKVDYISERQEIDEE